MNTNQRIVLGLGLLLVILNGLFPPFEGEDKGKGLELVVSSSDLKEIRTIYMGYHFLFTPPSQWDVFRTVNKIKREPIPEGTTHQIVTLEDAKVGKFDSTAAWPSHERLVECNSYVVTSIFFIQFATIVGATTGACLLFGQGNSMNEKK
ncbi:MAG: hypothetical protein ACLQAH_00280 [Limisphaerales bacterium]